MLKKVRTYTTASVATFAALFGGSALAQDLDLAALTTAVAGIPAQASGVANIMLPIVVGAMVPFIILKLVKRGGNKV